MKKAKDLIEKYTHIILLIIFILAVYLISVFPPSGDDFNRLHEGFVGISGGIERVKRLYQTLNGRVLGNEISYVFIERVPRTIFKTLALLSYIVLMMKVLRIRRLSGFFLILGSLILMPLPVFRQVWVWSAGFYNYIPPLILILVLVYLFIYHRNKFSKTELVLTFLISLEACLFMENLSIYVLGLPVLMALTFWNRDNIPGYLASFLGALTGTVIMFLSPVYRKVTSGDDDYRDVAENLVEFVIENWEIFSEYLLVFNIFIMVLFAGAFMMGIYKKRKEGKGSLQALALANILALIPLTLIDLGQAGHVASLVLHISFYLVLILIGTKEYKMDNFNSRLLVFACLSMALAMAPLLVVSPVSARNFFTPIVFNLFIIISLIRLNGLDEKVEDYFNKIAPLIMVGVFGFYLIAYSKNYSTFMARDAILRDAIERDLDEVQIPAYKFKDLNGGYGTDTMGNYYYREVQKDIKIEVIEYDEFYGEE